MSNYAKECWALAAVLVIMLAALLVGLNVFKSYQCDATWKRSGLKSEWTFLQGCLVELPDGRWMPSERLREIDIKPRESK